MIMNKILTHYINWGEHNSWHNASCHTEYRQLKKYLNNFSQIFVIPSMYRKASDGSCSSLVASKCISGQELVCIKETK